MEAADAKGELLAFTTDSNDFRAVTEVVVYTPDHPGLFSQIAGAIAVSGGSIVDAKAFTTADGFALDIFSVQDTEGGPFGDPERARAACARPSSKTLAGEIIPHAVFAKRPVKKRATAFNIRPQVDFDNEASAIATVIEVEGAGPARACFTTLPAPSSNPACRSPRPSWRPMASARWTSSMSATAIGHKIVHPDRQASVRARIVKAIDGESA